VAPRRVHEELQRVERARDRRGRDPARLLGRLVAHDDVALFERGTQTGDVVLGQLVLVGESLDVLLLDETALGGLLEQALDRREVVQVNRVAQCVVPFARGGLPDVGAPAALHGLPRGAATRPSYRTALHRSPFPNQVFFYFRTKSHSLLTRQKSAFYGTSGNFPELDTQNDDVRPELPRFGRSARGARKTLPQEAESGLDRLAGELLARPLGDDAPPASLAVCVVLVDFDADARIFAQHRGFPALGRDRDDCAVLVRVDERHHVGRFARVAAEARDPLPAQKFLDLAA
jgi:hypothetical protein